MSIFLYFLMFKHVNVLLIFNGAKFSPSVPWMLKWKIRRLAIYHLLTVCSVKRPAGLNARYSVR